MHFAPFTMAESHEILFKLAQTRQEFEGAARLFQEYAQFVGIDLSFQNFSTELQTIDKQYSKPQGALLLAYDGDHAVGCVAVRSWEGDIAELKRMFVQKQYQGKKIGQRLLEEILNIAKELSYTHVRLDTLPDMKGALQLYRLYGFYEIPAYRFNPIEGTIYMEKRLQKINHAD
jgi:ribosomal protein S18 acetylase RimI-like enzyme